MVAQAREIAHAARAAVRLTDKISDYPGRLSGGQQQRVAIASALAMEPVLLLFDKITSALNPQLTGEVVRVFEELATHGRTMILVTHEMGAAQRVATQIVFVHNARVCERGTPQQVLNQPATPEPQSFRSAVIQ